MACKLCDNEAELQNSHIIPEHVYGKLYDDKHRYSGITLDGDTKLEQKGLRERLLCRECEQMLNDKYEKYFYDFWIRDSALPDSIDTGCIIITVSDYIKFKLYMLSILYRASISSLNTFSGVSLGVHEDRIKNLLMTESDCENYSIFGTAICNSDNRIEKRIIIPPCRKRYGGHVVYQIIFAGCAWYIKTSNHRCHDIEEFCLKPNGQLQLTVDKMHDFAEIINIHNTLTSSENGKTK